MEKKKSGEPAERPAYETAVLTHAEVDPAVLYSIRKKNSAADTVWYLVSYDHHVTGNPNLLTDFMPVCDRWVQSFAGERMQVCARGSVNCNGIRLDDIWYVPGIKFNIVDTTQLTSQGLSVIMDEYGCSILQGVDGGTVVGKGHVKNHLYELDFLDTISAIPSSNITSNAAEQNQPHLKNFTPTRPVRPIRSIRPHTSTILLAHGNEGNGSVNWDNHFASDVLVVPGLTRNILSLSQLTESGFTVTFDPNGCTVKRSSDGVRVGVAS